MNRNSVKIRRFFNLKVIFTSNSGNSLSFDSAIGIPTRRGGTFIGTTIKRVTGVDGQQ